MSMNGRGLKVRIKQWCCSSNPCFCFVAKRIMDILRFCYGVKGLLTDPVYRSVLYVKLFCSKQLQQTTPDTRMNRYPVIFQGCKDLLEGKEKLNILSFGCCTGEEVFTLRQYFPNAILVGTDINPYCLEVCKRNKTDEKMHFVVSDFKEIKKMGDYDAVFCMAVLQRTPKLIAEKGIKNLKKIYPFEKFEKQVQELDKYVKPGGLLIICYTQYDFNDTSVAGKYKAIENYMHPSMLFDKNSQWIKWYDCRHSIFRKEK